MSLSEDSIAPRAEVKDSKKPIINVEFREVVMIMDYFTVEKHKIWIFSNNGLLQEPAAIPIFYKGCWLLAKKGHTAHG